MRHLPNGKLEALAMTPPLNRRDFLGHAGAAASAAILAGATPSVAHATAARNALPKSAVELVTLGKTGIQVSLVGMGTGSVGVGQASNQTRLGVKGFTKVVRHALERGVRLFDVADQYGSHAYLRAALKGVPREQYVIQTKTHAANVANARSHIERYRMELDVDQIDIVLLHCMQKKDWPTENTGAMDYLMQAKAEGLIRAHGTSCHGIDPLRTAARSPFVEVDLARINPEGLLMDAAPDVVASELEEMHSAGKGVIGMKILGEGRITKPEAIDASVRHVLGLGTVDAFIIGFESSEQIDDMLKRVDDALTFLRSK